MNDGLVPQDIVTSVVAAIVHSRSILLTYHDHAHDVLHQIESVVQLLTRGVIDEGSVIVCSPEVRWPWLASKLAKSAGSGLLLRRVERLNRDVQLHLGYELMEQPNRGRNAVVVVCTSVHAPERLHPVLRKLIMLKQEVDMADERLAMVEMPSPDTYHEEALARIREKVPQVTIVPELERYMQDIVLYVRAHRLVRGGLPPQSVRDFYLIVRTLCVFHGMGFATPGIIKHAARLVLPLKIRLVEAEDEPSLQYGGDLDMVKVWIRDWDSDVLVDSVLHEVPVPL